MKLNRKGFVITAILYGLLLLFVMLVSSYLLVLSARKNRLDNIVKGVEGKYNQHTVKIIAYDIKDYLDPSDDEILDNAFMYDENEIRHENQYQFTIQENNQVKIISLEPTDNEEAEYDLFYDNECGFYPVVCNGNSLNCSNSSNECTIEYIQNVDQLQHAIVNVTLKNIKKNMTCKIYFTNDDRFWRLPELGCNRLGGIATS